MKLNIGYELQYEFENPTPIILMLNVHSSRVSDLVAPDHIVVSPSAPVVGYRDGFGNWCTRVTAPQGMVRISCDAFVRDSGQEDSIMDYLTQVPVEELPEETLVFLLASRFCDSDRLLDLAWTLFGASTPGYGRVQDICDYVHNHIQFGYEHARVTRTATEAYEEQRGVCRDYAHLGVAFCRALNIPARYCTGYLSSIGTPLPHPDNDFAAWFEAYLGGRWHMFDPRNNTPRIGRVLLARGRDAADVAIATSFGPNTLHGFRVWNHEVTELA